VCKTTSLPTDEISITTTASKFLAKHTQPGLDEIYRHVKWNSLLTPEFSSSTAQQVSIPY